MQDKIYENQANNKEFFLQFLIFVKLTLIVNHAPLFEFAFVVNHALWSVINNCHKSHTFVTLRQYLF